MPRDVIDESTAAYLRSASAQSMLAELQPDDLRQERLLSTLTRLRRQVTGQEAGALVTLAQLRQRAGGKFPNAHRLYFVPEALEQATAWEIAARRARWMHDRLASGPVLDLGCGIGGDLLALAQHRTVIAYERDPVRLAFAQANVEAMGLANRVELRCADWIADLAQGRLPSAAGAFADPSRRRNGRRLFSLHEMEPPLASLIALQEQIPGLGVKVMPGVKDHEIPEDCGVEFTGHAGSCKEAVLWFGPLAIHRRWASVHVDDRWQEIVADIDDKKVELPVGGLNAGDIVYEPHPAVIRAGAFAELCRQLDAHLLDRQIAYLVSPTLRTHPLVRTFRALETHPFSLKHLNRRLQALNIGEMELKKRGFPVEPEQLRRRLKLVKGGRRAVLLITRRGSEHVMIIAERIVEGDDLNPIFGISED